MSGKKGSAASVAIVVIVLIVAVAIFFSFGGKLPFGPGGQLTYDNTVITISEKSISDLNPFSESPTSIAFFVANKGDKIVDSVKVDFFDIVGFGKQSLECHMDSLAGRKKADGNSCELEKIASLDEREVRLLVKAKKLETTDAPLPAAVSYRISFPYSGRRIAQIPVVGFEKSLPPGVQFSVSSATVGPVQVNVEPPIGAQKIVGGSKVDETFAREGLPFTVKLSLSDVGSPPGQKEPLIFEGDSVRVKLENAEIISCDKLDENGKLKPGVKEKLPFDIECTLKTTAQNIESYVFATLDIQFAYTYAFIVSDTFTVRPPLKTGR